MIILHKSHSKSRSKPHSLDQGLSRLCSYVQAETQVGAAPFTETWKKQVILIQGYINGLPFALMFNSERELSASLLNFIEVELLEKITSLIKKEVMSLGPNVVNHLAAGPLLTIFAAIHKELSVFADELIKPGKGLSCALVFSFQKMDSCYLTGFSIGDADLLAEARSKNLLTRYLRNGRYDKFGQFKSSDYVDEYAACSKFVCKVEPGDSFLMISDASLKRGSLRQGGFETVDTFPIQLPERAVPLFDYVESLVNQVKNPEAVGKNSLAMLSFTIPEKSLENRLALYERIQSSSLSPLVKRRAMALWAHIQNRSAEEEQVLVNEVVLATLALLNAEKPAANYLDLASEISNQTAPWLRLLAEIMAQIALALVVSGVLSLGLSLGLVSYPIVPLLFTEIGVTCLSWGLGASVLSLGLFTQFKRLDMGSAMKGLYGAIADPEQQKNYTIQQQQ